MPDDPSQPISPKIDDIFPAPSATTPESVNPTGTLTDSPVNNAFPQSFLSSIRPQQAMVPPGYAIEAELGRGGMGIVYLARQAGLNRTVALKMVLGDARPADLIRFLAEAEAAAALDHPNVVRVYESGQTANAPFLVMEHCPGGTLAARLMGGALPAQEAAALIAKLARGVAAAHDLGIVHRDLKPGNVLFDASGEPKVADFGLAKRGSGTDLTRTDAMMGTPSYMSPEQARGAKLAGPAADVWALGVILYECLAGRRPFVADDPMSLLVQVATDDPTTIRSIIPGVPRDLELICLKCLEKDPRRRYRTAGALADELGRFLAGDPVSVRPAGTVERAARWTRRNPYRAALTAVVTAAVVSLAVGAVVYTARLKGALGLADAHAEEARRQVVRLHVAVGARALDDGDWALAAVHFVDALALDEGRPGEAAHRVRVGAALRACPHLDGVYEVAEGVRQAWFAPDGRTVTLAEESGRVQAWDIATGGSALPAPEPPPDSIEIAPDGVVRVRDSITGPLHVIRTRHVGPVTVARLSPDKLLLLTAGLDGTVAVWNVATGVLAFNPVRHRSSISAATWSADGKRVATGGDDNVTRVWDAGTGDPLTPWLRHTGSVTAVAFSADGQRLATVGLGRTVKVWALPAHSPGLIHRTVAVYQPLRWSSPDGHWEAVATEGRRKLRVRSVGSAEWNGPTLLHGSLILAAAFSPDNDRIATGGDDNSARVWNSQTGEPITPPLNHHGNVFQVAFAPSGRWLAAACADGTVWVWDAGSGDPLTPPLPSGGRVESIQFDGDDQLMGRLPGGRIVTWNLSPDPRPVDALRLLAEILAGVRPDPRTGGMVSLGPTELRDAWLKTR